MADNRKRTMVVNRNGFQMKIKCSDEVADMLMSKTIDPSVKELIVNGLLDHQTSTVTSCQSQKQPEPRPSTSSASRENEPEVPSARAETLLSTNHIWEPAEEDMLVALRHERHDDFSLKKNHATLWKEITEELNKNFKTAVTVQQVVNKYNNLKKRWKEIIDARSGSEAKYFRQRDAFDQLYGTKISSRPKFILDSGKKRESVVPIDVDDGEGEKVIKKIKKKSTPLMDFMEAQDSQFNRKWEEFHKEKMKRFDRLLDLYESDINSRRNES